MKIRYRKSTLKKIIIITFTILVIIFSTYSTSKLYTYTCKELEKVK